MKIKNRKATVDSMRTFLHSFYGFQRWPQKRIYVHTYMQMNFVLNIKH